MKKLLSICIAVAMLFSLCAVSAGAANGPKPSDPEGFYGARIGFSRLDAPETAYVVNDKGEGLIVDNSALAGATYDPATNTLTLNNVAAEGYSLFIWFMGDDFKLNVVGDCAVGIIYVSNQFGVYNTNLHITGDGSLTVNEGGVNEGAIYMFADGAKSNAKLSVDESVTLHLYGGTDDGLIINNYGTSVATAAGAISVGGEGIDGVVGERIVYTEYDEANLMVVRDTTREYTDGYAAKSKSDPTGTYSVSWWEEDGSRYVKRYIYAESLGLWIADQDFGEWGGITRTYTKDEFGQEYTIEQSEQPVKIRFTDDDREANIGFEVTKFAKADEPGVVFGGSGSWRSMDPDYSKPEGYIISRLNWDETQGVYVEDESVSTEWVSVDEMEDAGWSIVTATETRQKEMSVWSDPAPYSGENKKYHGKVYRSKTSGDEYIQSGTYTSDTDSGAILRKIRYDEQNEEYYSQGSGDVLWVSTASTGGEIPDNLYEPVTEEVTEPVKVHYINSYYDFEDYSSEAILTTKSGEEALYAVRIYDYDGEVQYSVNPIELRANGHYYALKWSPDDSGYYVRSFSPDEFSQESYSFKTSDQDTPFTRVGQVDFFSAEKYTDTAGGLYGADWNAVYAYSEGGRSLDRKSVV